MDEEMKIEKLEYFEGLFEKPDHASSSEADFHVRFEYPEIPEAVRQSFINERIDELRGEFGIPGVGEPEQVDFLKLEVGGESWETRVINRAITLFSQDNEEVRRLHRFFCVIRDTVRNESH